MRILALLLLLAAPLAAEAPVDLPAGYDYCWVFIRADKVAAYADALVAVGMEVEAQKLRACEVEIWEAAGDPATDPAWGCWNGWVVDDATAATYTGGLNGLGTANKGNNATNIAWMCASETSPGYDGKVPAGGWSNAIILDDHDRKPAAMQVAPASP